MIMGSGKSQLSLSRVTDMSRMESNIMFRDSSDEESYVGKNPFDRKFSDSSLSYNS